MARPTDRELLYRLVDEIAEGALDAPLDELSDDDSESPAEMRAALLRTIVSTEET